MRIMFFISCFSAICLAGCTAAGISDKRDLANSQPQQKAPEEVTAEESESSDAFPNPSEQANPRKMLASCLGVAEAEVQMDRNVSLSLVQTICDAAEKAGVDKGIQDNSNPIEL